MDEDNKDTQNQEETNNESSDSLEQNNDVRTFGILGYIIPPLFFIPLLNDRFRNNKAVWFHANQQLLLLIGYFGIYVIHQFSYMILSSLSYTIWQVANFVLLVLAIIGAVNAYKGEQKELPLIGHIKLLK
tara:strand:- start:174 stop:563 length:390 start_codon:yes stop_codon:yes gene_type:complete